MKMIQYVGRQPRKVDNVLYTGRVWHGQGDVLEVEDDAAETYCRYPDQWAAIEAGTPESEANGERASEQASPPEAPAARQRAIIAAIGALDRHNAEAFTVSGKPQVLALEARLGYDISASERDAAWSEVNGESAG